MKLKQKVAVAFLRKKFRLLTVLSKENAAQKAVQLFCTPQMRVNKELSPLFKKAERLHFDLNGTTVHGFRWNHPSKHKLLILHGFDSSVVNFELYIEPLLKKEYEILAFDAPAHGKSGGTVITAIIYRDMIQQIHEQYGPVQSFLAHSMGGLALMLAMENIKYDDNTKLVLIAPATESVTAVDNFFEFLQIKDNRVRTKFDNLIEEMTGHSLSWFSITRVMEKIDPKVLWVHDSDDKVTPLSDTIKIREQNHPDLKFVITHGLGHRRIYRDKKVVNAVVDYL